MIALLRIAVNKYILSGETDDVSDALERLLAEDLLAVLGERPCLFLSNGHGHVS